MRKFEYCKFKCDYGLGDMDGSWAISKINEMGRNGGEMVAIDKDNFAWFKREVGTRDVSRDTVSDGNNS